MANICVTSYTGVYLHLFVVNSVYRILSEWAIATTGINTLFM